MLSRMISVGDKIDLQALEGPGENGEEQVTYHSMVYDILSEDTLELTMPLEKSKLVLLPVGSEYRMISYGETGLYQCLVQVTGRRKSDNVFILGVRLSSGLSKYQRRAYYRYNCTLDMQVRSLSREEIRVLEKKLPFVPQPGLPMEKGVIADISGGGLRFVSQQRYEAEEFIYCAYILARDGKRKEIEAAGRVLSVRELEEKRGTFEHRVAYCNLSRVMREEIIKYIFEEERKIRKKENLM